MDITTSSKPMSAPPAPSRVQQSSIRSFFQPRTPNYVPSANASTPATRAATPSIQSVASSSPPTNRPALKIPTRATITQIDPSHIQPLRRINSLLLPVAYPDSFYNSINPPNTIGTPSFSRIILWQDAPSSDLKVVGGIVCRLDPSLATDSTPSAPKYDPGSFDIYVQSLGLLSPYRGYGLATAALQNVIEAATTQRSLRIVGLYAHVWTENTEGLKWYAARSFRKEDPVLPGYYKRLSPDSAWILRRRLQVGDHLSPAAGTRTPDSAGPEEIVIAPNNSSASRPPGMPHTTSFQDRRPDREWNDLPEDMGGGSLLKPPSASTSKEGSATSSRSSSRGEPKKKKERLYPAAAFGS